MMRLYLLTVVVIAAVAGASIVVTAALGQGAESGKNLNNGQGHMVQFGPCLASLADRETDVIGEAPN